MEIIAEQNNEWLIKSQKDRDAEMKKHKKMLANVGVKGGWHCDDN